jgi:hypothetical protein
VLVALLVPEDGLATRYASPSGTSLQSCASPATACTLEKAIEGSGGNVPTSGEEVVILSGTYPTQTTEIFQGASNLNIHGEGGKPRPVINQSGIGRFLIGSGSFSYLHLQQTAGASEAVNMSGSNATIDRVFMESSGDGTSPVCQCYFGLVRNSVLVSNAPDKPAIGVVSNGGSGNVVYRNVTAYSSVAGTPALGVTQVAATGTLSVAVYNSIVFNAGGSEILADGPNSTITLSHANYRTTSTPQGGVVQDAPGGGHQTATPKLANPAGDDFAELPGSPTIDAGITDPLNGPLDFAGQPRTVDGSTDIGAYEFIASSPSPSPPTAPTFTLTGRKVKVKRSGKGRLGLSCTIPAGDACTVVGTLTTGGAAKKRAIGVVSGAIPGGTTGKLLIELNKKGRKRIAAKRKLRAALSGQVKNAVGLSSPLAASLKLKLKAPR